MRRGVISLGKVQCDSCQRIIPYAERYLVIEEEDGVEVESGKKSYYCVDCCLKKGYAEYRNEKGETVLTFFPGESKLQEPDDEKTSEQAGDNE